MTKFTLRPETGADDDFLRRLYASTRSDEMAMIPWTDAQKAAFLNQQFDLQRHGYRTRHPDADFMIVERAGVPAGRRYLSRSGDRLHLIDIALLPECRGQGLGTALLLDLLGQAAESGRSVSLYVQAAHRAANLYQRLGFAVAGTQDGIHWFMEWHPPAAGGFDANR